MLDDVGARPPIANTANQVRNPTVPLPFPAEEVVRGLDAVIVTHRHRDHLDERAEELLPRDVPVFCQPEDEEALRELGLDARAVADELDWDGLRVVRTPAQHGFGEIAEALGPVSGFVLDDLYLAGDTVWYDARRGDDRAPPATRGRRPCGRRRLPRGRADRHGHRRRARGGRARAGRRRGAPGGAQPLLPPARRPARPRGLPGRDVVPVVPSQRTAAQAAGVAGVSALT